MPSEPLSLDRKELLRERKNNLPAGKWKSGDDGTLRQSRTEDGFRFTGNHRLYCEEVGFGSRAFSDSRPWEKKLEDENSRPSSSYRSEGKINRNCRDAKSSDPPSRSFIRHWKGYHSDASDCSLATTPGRHDISLRNSSNHCNSIANSGGSDRGYQVDKMGINGYSSRYSEKSMDVRVSRASGGPSLASFRWKPMNWARVGGSNSPITHRQSSICKNDRLEVKEGQEAVRMSDPVVEVPAEPSEKVAAAETSCSRKKQRLSWGQGLAKYEKQKVDGPDDVGAKSDVSLQSPDCRSDGVPFSRLNVGGDRMYTSPRFSTSTSCSSPSGIVDEFHMKAVAYSHPSEVSPGDGQEDNDDKIELGHLDRVVWESVNSLISEVMHPRDLRSDPFKSAAAFKLTSVKCDIMAFLEKAECEIDQCENELRTLGTEISSLNASNEVLGTTSLAKAVQMDEKNSFSRVSLQFRSPADISKACNHDVGEAVCQKLEKGSLVDGLCVPLESSLASNENVCQTPSVPAGVGLKSDIQDKNQDYARNLDRSVFHMDDVRRGTPLSESATICSGESVMTTIFSLNQDIARQAEDKLFELIPVNMCKRNNLLTLESARREHDLDVEERFRQRKKKLWFKERALLFKFRAFTVLWKEDLRLLSLRKLRNKPPKRPDISRSTNQVSQKNRSSSRTRFTVPGSPTLVPTTEVVNFTCNLLAEGEMKMYRQSLKMPAMTIDDDDVRHSRFISQNGLVEDPCAIEREKAMANPWSAEERETFMELLATFGKDFSKISSSLKHKTTADCVEFYYKSHKSDAFAKIRTRMQMKKQTRSQPNAYLVTSGKKWNPISNSISLDILGAASAAAAAADHVRESTSLTFKFIDRRPSENYYDKTFQVDNSHLSKFSDMNAVLYGRESREGFAGDVITGIYGQTSSDPVSSCVTSSIDHYESFYDSKWPKMGNVEDALLPPEVLQSIDEDDCSDDSFSEMAFSDWTDAEKFAFISAFRRFGKDFLHISERVGSRSIEQCKVFFSKSRKCLGLDFINDRANEGSPTSDAHGGRSNPEDACIVQMESDVCTSRSCVKIEPDVSPIDSHRSLVTTINEDFLDAGSNSSNNPLYGKESASSETEEGQLSKEDLEPRKIVVDGHEADVVIEESTSDHMYVKKELLEEAIDSNLVHWKNCFVDNDLVHQLNLEPKFDDVGKEAKAQACLPGDDCQASKGVRPQDLSANSFAELKIDGVVDLSGSCTGLKIDGVSNLQRNCSENSPSALFIRRCSFVPDLKDIATGKPRNENYASSVRDLEVVAGNGNSNFSRCSKASGDCSMMVFTSGPDSNIMNNACNLSRESNAQPAVSLVSTVPSHPSNGPPVMKSEVLPCTQRPIIINLQQENSSSLTLTREKMVVMRNLPKPYTNCLKEETPLHVGQSGFQLHDAGHKPVQLTGKAVCNFTDQDMYRRCLVGHQPSRQADLPLQNFRGYPLQVSNKKDDAGVGLSSISEQKLHLQNFAGLRMHEPLPNSKQVQSLRMLDPLQNSKQVQNSFFIRENGHQRFITGDEYPFLPRNHEVRGHQLSSETPNLFEVGNSSKMQSAKRCDQVPLNNIQPVLSNGLPSNGVPPTRTSEVKLFGRSLVVHTHASDKPTSRPEIESAVPSLPMPPYPLLETSGSSMCMKSPVCRVSEEASGDSFGVWNGNKIQSRVASLPTASIVVSGQQSLANPINVPPHNSEQPIISTGKEDEHLLFCTRDVTGKARDMTAYELYSGSNQTGNVQPFTIEVNRPHSAASDIHKRSLMLERRQRMSLHQQKLGVEGLNAVSCLSDPVLALQMQFGENFCNPSRVKEENTSWRGDISR